MIKLHVTARVDHSVSIDIDYDVSLIGCHKYSDCLDEETISRISKKLIKDIKNNDVNFELEVTEQRNC